MYFLLKWYNIFRFELSLYASFEPHLSASVLAGIPQFVMSSYASISTRFVCFCLNRVLCSHLNRVFMIPFVSGLYGSIWTGFDCFHMNWIYVLSFQPGLFASFWTWFNFLIWTWFLRFHLNLVYLLSFEPNFHTSICLMF